MREASLIIWDEASMANKEDIEVVDMFLRDVCSNTRPFSNKVFLIAGDFREVLHVSPRKTQCEDVEASIVSSYL